MVGGYRVRMATPLIRKPVLGMVEKVLLNAGGYTNSELRRLLEEYGFDVVCDWYDSDPPYSQISRIEFGDHDWSDRDVVQRLLDVLSEAIMVHQTIPRYAEADVNRMSSLLDIFRGEGFAWTGSRFDWSGQKSLASSVDGLHQQEFAKGAPTVEIGHACAPDGGGEVVADGRGEVSKAQARIFIGHGRSGDWIVLRDFVERKLGLQWSEFNRESPAGYSAKERLKQMLDSSCFAFLVMTAEDEHPDGTRHARENVVHEIGLFQGRLGFERAIILHEEGCEDFSNVHGLQDIRYPKGRILAVSEELREVLEREGIISKGS
jgi:hypothetical protein